ncbi:chromodomain-helicase-DNA-binding protein 4 [Ceratobasidium sp. AG-Ba]|nr:chromodomain-helicase-DNA-binding protein 4 [Ceratobasidium sp. AG-Ba]
MARSKSPGGTRASSEVADSEIQVDDNSEDEILSISNKSPAMPSSVERTLPPHLPKFWVEIPPRPKSYEEYGLINVPLLKNARDTGSSRADDGSPIPLKIVGQVDIDGREYYYAEVEGDIIRKFPLVETQAKYRNLVKEYNNNKRMKRLPKLDPNDVKIHPKDRANSIPQPKPKAIKLVVATPQTRNNTKSKSRSASARSSTLTKVSSDDNYRQTVIVSSDDSDSDGDGDGDFAPERQSKRLAGKLNRSSPRKRPNLRSRYESTDEGLDSGSVYSVDDNEDSDDSGTKKKGLKVTLKRARAKRDTIKGLGVIRSISDAEESDSGAEGVYLRRHRRTCDRCQEGPSHLQLEAYQKRKSKGGHGRKKKKADDDDESEDEEERLERLGGWIRCLRCCMSKHWGCLTGQEKLDVLLAAQKHETETQNSEKRARGWDVPEDAPMVPKRKSIWLDQTTEYVCDMCTRTGPCLICREDTSPKGAPLAPVAPPDPIPSLAGGSGAEDAIDLTTPPPEIPIAVQLATPGPNSKDGHSSKSSAKPLTKCQPGEVLTRYASPNWHQVLFRCIRCRRPAHWQHVLARDLSDKGQRTANQIAQAVQHEPDAWKCHDCVRWVHPAEAIIAWRPETPDVVENFEPGTVPNLKDPLRREYLVKFKDRGFKRAEWVPHMWLVSMHPGMLRNFLKSGTRLPLLEDDSEEFQEKTGALQKADKGKAKEETLGVPQGFARSRSASAEVDRPAEGQYEGTPGPMPDAELRIPNSWLLIDRILDVRLRLPPKAPINPPKPPKKTAKGKEKGNGKGRDKGKANKNRIADPEDEDEDELESESEQPTDDNDIQFVDGIEPDQELTESLLEFESRIEELPDEPELIEEIQNRAVWIFVKFQGLQYDECAWDSPPKPGSLEWESYLAAIPRFVFARSVEVHRLVPKDQAKRDNREKRGLAYWSNMNWQPDLEDKSLSLMPFQVQGLHWLYGNWWNLQPSILADDMGLGKTVQLVSLIGRLVKERVYPHLIVVPNSTIVNWIREFERWTPHVRVVQFNGEAKARQVIKDYELWNSYGKQMYHALVTTYETLQGVDFTPVFKKPGRWEVLVVDEGQRLKSDSSLLFRKLSELHTVHRILMTGTPLNNNIRELFNLMNFLDPQQWNNLDALEKEYDQENLTEKLLASLHDRLRPYFLRRQKAEVLDLPDKHEVIVPVSLAPIQKRVMRGILENNLSSLISLADKSERETRKGSAPKKTTLNNALMEMRKCIQHPYLTQPDLERRGLSPEETLKQLVDASAKFRLLQKLLPQLKQRGHRVLLFSQFKIVLDIIEDFLNGEGYKLLRLDGDTKSALRQKEIDDFNRPGSDYFIYILTTRAGGVGVNLWSADTVIVFDPDFNPHQDLQAIARAHRYGQKKRVLVFKFMGKDTPEEKMFMMGKKKLVLDHLIVQKLGDEDEMDDIQGLLTFGAKALFESTEESASDIKYTEQDIEQLITRAETEKVEEKTSTDNGMKFGFAQVWDPTKGAAMDIPDEDQIARPDDDDFWAQVLKRSAEEKAQKRAQEKTGRGARKRAITNYNELDLLNDGSPEKIAKGPKPKNAPASKSSSDGDRDFNPGGDESSSSEEGNDTSTPDDRMLVLPHLPGQQATPALGSSTAGSSGHTAAQKAYVSPHFQPSNIPGGSFPAAASTLLGTMSEKPEKPKKPRAKKPIPEANSTGQPPIAATSSKLPPPGLSEQEKLVYGCQLCSRLHRIGQCPMNSNVAVDKLLLTRAQIMRPDNEDEETHKFWALQHIDKKLGEMGVAVARLPDPKFSGVAPKAKLQRLPITNAPASTGNLKMGPPPGNASGDYRISSVAGPVAGAPKPRKKKSNTVPPSQSSPSGPTSHSSTPLAQTTAPRPLTHAPSVQPGLVLHSAGNALAPTGVHKTSSGSHASASLVPSSISSAQAQSGVIASATSKPRIQPPTKPLSSSPPPVTEVLSSTITSTHLATKKRPAGDQPEEARKKRSIECLVCSEKPGHATPDCPQLQTSEGIKKAIQQLEAERGKEVCLSKTEV